jgi:hypothetical protein
MPASTIANHMKYVVSSDFPYLTNNVYNIFAMGKAYDQVVSQVTASMSAVQNEKDISSIIADLLTITSLSNYNLVSSEVLDAVGYHYAQESSVYNRLTSAITSDIAIAGLNGQLATSKIEQLDTATNTVDFSADVCATFGINTACADVSSRIMSVAAPAHASDLRTQVRSLSESSKVTNYHSLASVIGQMLYHNVDPTFVSNLEADITLAGLPIDDIKSYLGYVGGQTASEVVTNMYVAWSGNYLSAMEGAQLLAKYIDNNNIKASDIRSYDYNAMSWKWDDATKMYALANTVANLASSFNADLIRDLALDFTGTELSFNQLVSKLQNVQGNTGAEMVASLYRSLGFPYDSAVPGKRLLADVIKEHHDSDNIVTLSSMSGEIDVSPKDKFLNICTLNDETYTVGYSVFASFSPVPGAPLSAMHDLYTFSGREQARAECARYLVENLGQDLYVTTTQPYGVSGDATETGCTPVLEPAVFLAYCDAVFFEISYG